MITAARKVAVFKQPSTSCGGFSLLELVATLAVLSTLTAIAAVGFNGKGGIIGQINSANIDEAKALLNTAAADCLQKSRLNNENKDIVDDTIISDQRIKPIGFAIDKANNADKCSYFQLVPTNENDDVRYPIGFSVSDGVLSKFATPTSSDQGSISSCERWAGVNCKQDQSLKRLINWKKDIAANKIACEDEYTKWLTVDNTTPYKFQRWNPNAETGCPSRPARDGSENYQNDPTCTPNGCNREVFGLDGEFVGFTKEAYDQALEDKYGKLCTEWVAEQEQQGKTNNTTTLLPVTKTPECGSQEFWFFQGEDQGTKEKFMERACNLWKEDKNSKNYTNAPANQPVTTPECGDQEFWFVDGSDQGSFEKLQGARCSEQIDARRKSGPNGSFISSLQGPEPCGNQVWICDNRIVSESYYHLPSSGCFKDAMSCSTNETHKKDVCIAHETSDFMMNKCGTRPNLDDPDPYIRCGALGIPPKQFGRWDKNQECLAWASCMGYYSP